MSPHAIIEAQILPPGTSTQLAELIALTRALELGKDKRLKIYTGSKYAFLILHILAAIWKDKGYLNTKQGPIKYRPYILQLLEAVKLPQEIVVIYCRGHQKGIDEIAQGNNFADPTAKNATTKRKNIMGALFSTVNVKKYVPCYTKEEIDCSKQHGYNKDEWGWYQRDGLLHLPQGIQWKVIKGLHDSYHFWKGKTSPNMWEVIYWKGITKDHQTNMSRLPLLCHQ